MSKWFNNEDREKKKKASELGGTKTPATKANSECEMCEYT